MMTLGLHPRLIGRLAYALGLQRFLCHAQAQPGVWFATRGEIAGAWNGSALPAPADSSPGVKRD
jgi:hypothetical protein